MSGNKIDLRFEQLYERTKNSVLKYIVPRCASVLDIEDIYQEIYLRVYDAIKSERPADDPEAFIMGIAKHCVAHYYSVLTRMKMRISRSASDASGEEYQDIADDTDIEELAADRELCERIFRDISLQPPEVQKIFYLHYLMELSLGETAQTLGISESRVRQLLYKAVRQLKRKYRKDVSL